MEQIIHGLSRELIIHPGETINDLITEHGMTQKELAARLGVTEAFISNVISGKKGISKKLASSLGYVFDVSAKFWLNLQAMYDAEIAEYEEQMGISEEEKNIVSNDLKDIVKHLIKNKMLKACDDIASLVLEIRKFIGVNSLTRAPEVLVATSFRIQSKSPTNPYVLLTWLNMCDHILAQQPTPINSFNPDLLASKIDELKSIMFLPTEKMWSSLSSLFNECGISFCIVKHFSGAPIQGVIRRTGNQVSLCMTIRLCWADIFWFTLFHEVAHLCNQDFKDIYIHLIDTKNECEDNADNLAGNWLIEDNAYDEFVLENDFSRSAICEFSTKHNIMPYVLLGRLQKDEYLTYKDFYDLKERYKWVKDLL